MKTQTVLVLSLFLIFGIAACKLISYSSHAKRMSISFGSSGGFSGGTEEYILSGNGKLMHIKAFSKDSVTYKTISKQEIKRIFKLAESKSLLKDSLNEAGNMNNFIRIYRKGKLIQDYQWPVGKANLPEGLKELDKQLQSLKPLPF